MAFATTTPRTIGLSIFVVNLLVLLILGTAQVSALDLALCSSQNTGTAFALVSSDYQSNGLCFDTCKANYAFAVVQYQSCWCSDYAPADTTSTGSCNENCPGYPSEKCGSQSAGLFGYIALAKSPSGTAGAAGTSTSGTPTSASVSDTHVGLSPTLTTPLPSTSFLGSPSTAISLVNTPSVISSVQSSAQPPVPVTVQETVTASQSVSISLVFIPPSISPSRGPGPDFSPASHSSFSFHYTSSSSSSLPPTTSNIPSTSITPTSLSTSSISSSLTPSITSSTQMDSSTTFSWSATPITSVMTVTGLVTTVTITPTAPPPLQTALSSKQTGDGGFFSNPGKVAGLFVGIALIVLIVAGALIWRCLRRKRHSDVTAFASTLGEQTPQRRPSRLSQMGLLGGSRPMSEKIVPAIETNGWGPGGSAEKSPTDTPTLVDRRRSYGPTRVIDQRLEPTALWNPLHDNGSHISVRSFRDDQDYSRRMLRVANPDD